MDKKAIIGVGPALILVNLFALLIASLKVVAALGLVSGIVFNKKIKELGWKFLLPRIFIFLLLTFGIIVGLHLLFGPAANYHIIMLFGALIFLTLTVIFSINSMRKDLKNSLIIITTLTFLFIIISQASVFLAIK